MYILVHHAQICQPISSYGESVFLSIQTSLIALLVLWFGGSALLSIVFAAFYSGVIFALAQPGLVPEEVLWWGQAANIPMVLVGKLLQVRARAIEKLYLSLNMAFN